jgi:hypothetical protein
MFMAGTSCKIGHDDCTLSSSAMQNYRAALACRVHRLIGVTSAVFFTPAAVSMADVADVTDWRTGSMLTRA